MNKIKKINNEWSFAKLSRFLILRMWKKTFFRSLIFVLFWLFIIFLPPLLLAGINQLLESKSDALDTAAIVLFFSFTLPLSLGIVYFEIDARLDYILFPYWKSFMLYDIDIKKKIKRKDIKKMLITDNNKKDIFELFYLLGYISPNELEELEIRNKIPFLWIPPVERMFDLILWRDIFNYNTWIRAFKIKRWRRKNNGENLFYHYDSITLDLRKKIVDENLM